MDDGYFILSHGKLYRGDLRSVEMRGHHTRTELLACNRPAAKQHVHNRMLTVAGVDKRVKRSAKMIFKNCDAVECKQT